ncbi:D-alanine--D-alanine ligase family protein [Limnothrix redekei]|uniref:ATP-grasp domain-containing protein n=1 Tax=Limnothrix redekei LRLZ20PSL1 TaxID=3112953 RepID=A0ABW7C9Z4_9CYAN
MKLQLVYNLRSEHPHKASDCPVDADADWDTPETISFLNTSLTRIGFDVTEVRFSREAVQHIIQREVLIFNICEMTGGAYREALIPSLCEIHQIPYVFSQPDVMVKALDKNICNLLVQQSGIDVPSWLFLKTVRDLEILKSASNYPYIVKPHSEGSGMGISDQSVVYSYQELYARVKYILSAYRQSVVVQKYIDGLELTVGVIGNGDNVEVLAPVLVELPNSQVYGYVQKEDSQNQVTYSLCSDEKVNRKVLRAAKIIYNVLGCRDAARIDFRFDTAREKLYFLEVNPLPHLHPLIGDFCRSAYGSKYSYDSLLKKICNFALLRDN